MMILHDELSRFFRAVAPAAGGHALPAVVMGRIRLNIAGLLSPDRSFRHLQTGRRA
jgi:hypothetical protein